MSSPQTDINQGWASGFGVMSARPAGRKILRGQATHRTLRLFSRRDLTSNFRGPSGSVSFHSWRSPHWPRMTPSTRLSGWKEPGPGAPKPYGLDDLIRIMAILRTPVSAAPGTWSRISAPSRHTPSRKPTQRAQAIERGDLADLRDEIGGNPPLQVVFHARMAEEQDLFAFADVVDGICRKQLVRRHPHVFGDDEAQNAMESEKVLMGSRESRGSRAARRGHRGSVES